MKTTHFLLIILFLVFYLPAKAQISVKRLINKYESNTERYKNLETDFSEIKLKISATMSLGEMTDIPVSIWMSEPYMRMEMSFMGAKFLRIANDTLAWSRDPFSTQYEFEKLEKSNATTDADLGFISFGSFDSSLDKGWVGQQVSEVSIDSLDLYALLMTKELNEVDSITYYFDKENFYNVGSDYHGEREFYLNYTVVDGFLLPTRFFSFGQADGNVIMVVDQYEINPAVDDELFEMSEEAKSAYSGYIETIRPKSEKSPLQKYYEEGISFAENGDFTNAVESYSKALKINPNESSVLNRRGLAKMYNNDLYGAISDLDRAKEFADSTLLPTVYNNLGLAKYYLGDNEGAKNDYLKALDADSTNRMYNMNMGLLMIRLQDFESAEAYTTTSIKSDSALANAYYYRAVAKAQMQEYEGAIEDYNKAGELGVDLAEYYNYKGVTFYNLNEFEKAANSFKAAINRDSTNSQYFYNLAQGYEGMEDYQSSIQIYDLLVKRDSTSDNVYYARSDAYWSLAMTKAARRDIEKAIELNPQNALYYDYRAYMKEEAGDYTGAIEDFTTSLNLEQDPNIYFRRGLAKINISNKFDACKDFKKAEELGSEEAKEALTEHCKL